MSDMRSILADSAARLFADLCTSQAFDKAENGELDASAWNRLEEAGLTRATVPEAQGGDGADLGDALSLVRGAGEHALPLPLADTLLAQWVLAAAGLPAQAGIGTIGPVVVPGKQAANDALALTRYGDQWRLTGTLYRVPAARHAGFLAAIAACEGAHATVLLRGALLQAALTRRDINFANEPRDTLAFRDLPVDAACVGPVGGGLTAEELRFLGAAFRAVAMSGAMGRVLKLAVAYATERVQFGKPLGGFQVIQHGLAVLASQVAAANAAADAVVDALSRGAAHFEIAAAKARVGEAAHIVNGLAHQIHGAMGFTHEHALHRSTRRLWAWRDEFGNEAEWAEWIGRIAVRLGGDGLWPFLTAEKKQVS